MGIRGIFKLLTLPRNRAYHWLLLVEGLIFGATIAYVLLVFCPLSMLPKDISHYEDYLYITQGLFPNNRITNYVATIASILLFSGLYYLIFLWLCHLSAVIRKQLRGDSKVIEAVRISILFALILSMCLLALVVISISKSRNFPEGPETAMAGIAKGTTYTIPVPPGVDTLQPAFSFRNGLLAADFRITGESWSVFLRENPGKPSNHYVLTITPRAASWDIQIRGRSVDFAKNVVGNIFTAVRPYPPHPSSWNRLVVWSHEDRFRVWINGVLLMTMSDTDAHRKGSLVISKGPSVGLRNIKISIFGENHYRYIGYIVAYLLAVALFIICVTSLPNTPFLRKTMNRIWPRIYDRILCIIRPVHLVMDEAIAPVFWFLTSLTAAHFIASLLLNANLKRILYTLYSLPLLLIIVIWQRKPLNKMIQRYGLFALPLICGTFYLIYFSTEMEIQWNFLRILVGCSLVIMAVYTWSGFHPRSKDLLGRANLVFLRFTPLLWMSFIAAVFSSAGLQWLPYLNYFSGHILSPMNIISHGMFLGADYYQHFGIGFFYVIYGLLKTLGQETTVFTMQRIYWIATTLCLTSWIIYMRMVTKSWLLTFLGFVLYITFHSMGYIDSHNHFVRSFLFTPTLLCLVILYHQKQRPIFMVSAGFLTGYLILHGNLTGIVHFVAMLAYLTFLVSYKLFTNTDPVRPTVGFFRTILLTLLAAIMPLAFFVAWYVLNGKLAGFIQTNPMFSLGNFPIWAFYYEKLNFYPTTLGEFLQMLHKAEISVVALYLITISFLIHKFLTRQLRAEDFSIFFLTTIGLGFYSYHLYIVDHPTEFRIAVMPYVPILFYLIGKCLGKWFNVIKEGWHDRASHLFVVGSTVVLLCLIFEPSLLNFKITQQTTPIKPFSKYVSLLYALSKDKRSTEDSGYMALHTSLLPRLDYRIQVGQDLIHFEQLIDLYQVILPLIKKNEPVFIISNHSHLLYYIFDIPPPWQTIFNQTTWTKRYYQEVIETLQKCRPSMMIVQKGFKESIPFTRLFDELKFDQHYRKVKEYPGLELFSRLDTI